jgi:hypothetical protein
VLVAIPRRARTDEQDYCILRERDEGVGQSGFLAHERAKPFPRERSSNGGGSPEGGPRHRTPALRDEQGGSRQTPEGGASEEGRERRAAWGHRQLVPDELAQGHHE